MKKRVLISVINNVVGDQRVHKTALSLQQNNYNPIVIGTRLQKISSVQTPYTVILLPLVFRKGKLFFLEFNIRLGLFLLFHSQKGDLLLANDLDSLAPNYCISKLKKLPLVFDSHEIYSEMPYVQGRFVQKIWRWLEKKLIPKLSYFYTVSDSCAQFFEENYGNRPKVIKNVPLCDDSKDVIPKTENFILYQGALNLGRGLPYLIQSLAYLDEPIELYIVGTGPYEKELQDLVHSLSLENRVKFLGFLSPIELRKLTSKALLGVSIEEDLGLSYRAALPNKLFDYIHAEIPVLGSYVPEIKKMVETYQIGEVIESHSPKHIAQKIQIILQNGKQYYSKGLQQSKKENCWELQEKELLSIFTKAYSTNKD